MEWGKTTAIAGVRGSCAANVKVVHTFVLDWRENAADIRRDLSVANYQYTDTKKTLWAASASDTEESAAAKDADPTKAQKINRIIPQPNGILRNM